MKKELREYIRLTLYCQEKHKGKNHDIGQDSSCFICDNYLKLTKYIGILEANLSEIKESKRQIEEEKEREIFTKVPQKRTKKTKEAAFFVGEYEKEIIILRSTSMSKAKKEYPNFKGKIISQEDSAKIFVLTGIDSYCELAKVSDEYKIIAKQSQIDHPKNCDSRYSYEYLQYTGENHDKVSTFCDGYESFRTKKRNKMQINGNRGSISVAPGEFLVKNKLNHIYVYTEDEFMYLYKKEKINVWKEY